jgi:hypothetical protein
MTWRQARPKHTEAYSLRRNLSIHPARHSSRRSCSSCCAKLIGNKPTLLKTTLLLCNQIPLATRSTSSLRWRWLMCRSESHQAGSDMDTLVIFWPPFDGLLWQLQQGCMLLVQFFTSATKSSWNLEKRAFMTLNFGLLHRSSTSNLVVYSDAYWVGCPDTHRPTSGYVVFLGNNLISWSFKRQNMISYSSAEAEYQAICNGVVETCWLCQLLMELHSPLSHSILVYCNNVSVVYLVSNRSASTYKTCRDWSPLHLWQSCHWGSSCSTRLDNFSVCWHFQRVCRLHSSMSFAKLGLPEGGGEC